MISCPLNLLLYKLSYILPYTIMPLTLEDCKKLVISKLSRNTYEKISNYVMCRQPQLWGEDKPHSFLQTNLLLTFYKDIVGIGYKRLLLDLSNLPFRLNHKSFQHNVEVLRAVVAGWARSTIKLGSMYEWRTAARNVHLDPLLKKVVFWMDSKDFRQEGRRSVKRSSPKWSYKCNSPAQRYMFLRDGTGKVRGLWGGYSPKTYDGHWLRAQRAWLEKKLKGAGVVADNHFHWGVENLHNVKFFCNTRKRKCCTEDEESGIIEEVTDTRRDHNQSVKCARARIENTFGEMVTTFGALSKPWASSDTQQDYLVQIAVGVHNSNC